MAHDARHLPGLGNVALIGGTALVAVLLARRALGREPREPIARAPRNGLPRPVLGSFDAERAVQWFQAVAEDTAAATSADYRNRDCGVDAPQDTAADPAAGATAPRDARDPAHREQTLIGPRCGFRAWMFWTGAPPETAKVGDVWAYVEKPSGEIVAKKRFRTRDEGWTYAKAALERALERAGKFDCY